MPPFLHLIGRALLVLRALHKHSLAQDSDEYENACHCLAILFLLRDSMSPI